MRAYQLLQTTTTTFFRADFELGRYECFVLLRLILKLEMMHIPGFLKFCFSRNLTVGRNDGERNGQLEGYSTRQCVFEDLQRCANSKWLTNGSDHNRNNNSSLWPDCTLLFPCSNSYAKSFVICLRNKSMFTLLTLHYFHVVFTGTSMHI